MTEVLATVAGTARRRHRAPRGQGERLRDEILAATERLLLEKGDREAVSIRAVADAVGVTPTSIYLHFADKSELIFTICEKRSAEFGHILERAASGAVDPVDALRLRAHAHVQFGLDHPEEYRILFMSKPASTPEEWGDLQLAALERLAEAVQGSLPPGSIYPGNPRVVAFGLWVAAHGLVSLFLACPGLVGADRDTLIDHVLEVQLAGLAGARPGPPTGAAPRRSARATPPGRTGRTGSPVH